VSGTVIALDGIRVLDLSTGVAGQYCGKLLAGYGADCVLAEPPDGTATRRIGPYLTSGRSSTRSALFRHLNQGKSSLVYDADDLNLPAVGALADVVIRDDTTPLTFSLPATAIECVIGEFPRDGQYSGWRGSEMVHQALSGAMYMTGWPDRQPLYGIGHRAYYACGTTAFISVMSALHERASSGLGQVVTATVFESNAAIGQNLVSQYSYNGSYETRRQYPGFLALLRCRDYWMVLFAIRHWDELCGVFGLEHLLTDERFGQQASRLEHWDVVVAEMQARARQFLASDLVAALQRARISAEVVAPLGALVTSAQWHARRLIQTAQAGGRAEAALGPPFAVGQTAYNAVRPSPVLRRGIAAERSARAILQRWCQHAAGPGPVAAAAAAAGGSGNGSRAEAGVGRAEAGVGRAEAGVGRAEAGVGRAGWPAPGRPGPLSGLRVLDMTSAWAGPFAARSLAHLGAEVIKIDAPSHTDSWRGAPEGGAARHYPDGDPGRHPWNRCVLFNTQGQGKLSIGLDLKIAGAREIMLRLAENSDVLIANFTPGVLDRLGIGYDALSARNPRIVVVEMPAFGPGGPDSGHQGMGKTMEAACGMAALMGYGEGPPVLTGPAYLDPIGGLSAVAATLVALHHRGLTGRGCHVEVPQTEAGAHWIGEHVLLQAESGRSWQPDGNAVADAAPHDAYPCRGSDEWVAIAVSIDEQWRALCQCMERPDLATSPRYKAHAGRSSHRHELDTIIARWTRQFGKHELAARLQASGVPAAPVNSGQDVARDTVLLRTGFIRELDHPEAGRHAYPGLAYQLARSPGGISVAAPCFGQHNEYLLRDLLGIDAERFTELQRSGAIADRPKGAQANTAADADGSTRPPDMPIGRTVRQHTTPTSRGQR
jgi:crotonobetainyl-CoA:carnitine CoA-transferase CaiB-like acyl-CoA transferase